MKNSSITEYDLPSEHFDFAIEAIERRIEKEKEIEKNKLIAYVKKEFTKRKWVFWGEIIPPSEKFVSDVVQRVLTNDFSDFSGDLSFKELYLMNFAKNCKSGAVPEFWLEMLEAIELAKGLGLSKITLCGRSALDAMHISVRYKESINNKNNSSSTGGNREN